MNTLPKRADYIVALPGRVEAYGFLVDAAADNEQLSQTDLRYLRILAEALKDAGVQR